jgi:restriction system protein
VSGPYKQHPDTGSPVRPIEWLRKDVPRDAFKQDLLYSFGAFMTVCEITRNDALNRVEQVIRSGIDPGDGASPVPAKPRIATSATDADMAAQDISDDLVDLEQIARDQIEKRLASVFTGHDLTRLVAAILEAQGKRVRVSPPGADAGVDIVAGSGTLGLESPRIVVQVKSGKEIVDQPTLQSLIGTLHDTKADFGLLVSWAGFTAPVHKRVNELYFRVRFWGRKEIIDNLFVVYDDLPEAIRAELPMRRTWTLVPDEGAQG